MIKKCMLTVLCFFLVTTIAAAEDEVTLPQTLKAGIVDLVLNGSGIRVKTFAFIDLDLYVAGLYLTRKNNDGNAIMDADEPMAIRLHITSRLITPQRMADAVEEGFIKATKGKTEALRPRIDKMISVFKDGIDVNDVYDFIYTPGNGVYMTKNNKQGILIEGLDFKKGLFGIWICDDPAQEDLKAEMLGR